MIESKLALNEDKQVLKDRLKEANDKIEKLNQDLIDAKQKEE